MSYDFKIGLTYSFEVYNGPIIGNDFKNVKLLGILDADSANQIIQTRPQHIDSYPYLPVGTPNNPAGYNYLKILTASGATTAIGIPWIKEASVTVIEFKKMVIEIDAVTLEDGPRAAAALIKNGFKNPKVSFQ